MKKFTVLALAVLFMMFIVSCDDDKTTEETLPDEEVTDEDVVEPTEEPTTEPTEEPTTEPTEEPTDEPTTEPTGEPTGEPTNPTDEPTTEPTTEPTDEPTGEPTNPTDEPTTEPTTEPTEPTEEPTEPTTEPTEPEETGSCSYIPNAFVSNWTDNFPTGWASKPGFTYEKVDRGDGDYALGATIAAAGSGSGGYAFDTPIFTTPADAAIPTKITFDLATDQTSKMSINIRCADTYATNAAYIWYNWDATSKTFIHAEEEGNNKYYVVDLGNTNFNNVEIKIGEEFTKDFWQGKECRIEFKYHKQTGCDIKVDNVIIHTATEDCVGEDTPDPTEPTEPALTCNEEEHKEPNAEGTECVCIAGFIADGDNCVEPALTCNEEEHKELNSEGTECVCIAGFIADGDNCVEDTPALTCDAEAHKEPNEAGTECVCMDGFVADGDDCVAPKCAQIPNGDFSGTWTDGTPKGWEKYEYSTAVTLSNVEEALKIQSNYTSDNQKAAQTIKFTTAADAEIPAGIKFKMAAPKASPVVISLLWGAGGNDYYSYNWNAQSNAFVVATDTNHRNNDFTSHVDFGDTSDPQMHDVVVIFGSEIAGKWQNNENLRLVFRAGNSSTQGETEIIVDDFELVYYGGECNNAPSYTVGWANMQWPKTVEGYEGMSDTFYGRVYIEGLTDQTVNKSVALMGVKAQFAYRAKNSDTVIPEESWKDAEINIAENNEFGNNDEYKITSKFEYEGNFEYMFRFSADNGQTWTKTTDFEDNETHTGLGYATILAPEAGQIGNADFKYWSNNTTTQVWTVGNNVALSKWDRTDANGLAAKVTATSALSAKNVFTSGEFVVPDGKKATEITFDMATDQSIQPKIAIDCGSPKWYGWDSEEGHNYFSASKSKFVAIDFGDDDKFHQTSVKLDSSATTGTCKIIIRYTASKDQWAAFDNFTVVYEDAE